MERSQLVSILPLSPWQQHTSTYCLPCPSWEESRAGIRKPESCLFTQALHQEYFFPSACHTPTLPTFPTSSPCLRLGSASKIISARVQENKPLKNSNSTHFFPCPLGDWHGRGGLTLGEHWGTSLQLGTTMGSLGSRGPPHTAICFVTPSSPVTTSCF